MMTLIKLVKRMYIYFTNLLPNTKFNRIIILEKENKDRNVSDKQFLLQSIIASIEHN